MNETFRLRVSPSPKEVDEVADLQSEDVFRTAACAAGYAAQGLTPVLFGSKRSGSWVRGCLGFLRRGRLTRALELPWLPARSDDAAFWSGLARACRELRVWDVSARRITEAADPMPELGHLVRRRRGIEYRLPLGGGGAYLPSGKNQRRNLGKATRLGMQLRSATDSASISRHLRLMEASMERRRRRGEQIPVVDRRRYYESMLDAGAGLFFQAWRGPDLESSMFVLRSARGAYYQSAGTSPQGMAHGASTFLVVEVANQLQEAGVTCFDLGGAPPENEGLRRFKRGFGADPWVYEIAEYSLAHAAFRMMRAGVRALRR